MEKTRFYSNLAGVDFSDRNVASFRSPLAVNMWKNYNADNKRVETRLGLGLKGEFGNSLLGLFFYRVSTTLYVLVHVGTKLYLWTNYPTMPVEKTELFSGMNIKKSGSFVMNNILFIKDGINYLEFDGTAVTHVEEKATIPITSTGRSPLGGGTNYQPVNRLQPKRINGFITDDTALEYALNATNLDPKTTYLMQLEYNGVVKTEDIDFTVNRTTGKVIFSTPLEKPATAGDTNMYVTFSKTVSGNADRVKKTTLFAQFDNRIFFAGHVDYPNELIHSQLENARYIADTNRYNEGNDLSPVRAVVVGDNALWTLKEPSQMLTTIYKHSPTIDSETGKVYPSVHTNISEGCVSTGVNFGDDIVFFSNKGLEAITGGLSSENVLSHRSSNVDSKLINESNYKDVQVVEYNGYLVCLIDNHVYLADSRQKFASDNGSTFEYEWYYWELPTQYAITFMESVDGKLFFGNEAGQLFMYEGSRDGVYPISSFWRMPMDSFDAPQFLKTTNKRGGTAEVEGSPITVRVRVDNEDWTDAGDYENEKGYIIYRIKKKKWKEIQLEFSSQTRFALYSCALEAFIGGYVKR